MGKAKSKSKQRHKTMMNSLPINAVSLPLREEVKRRPVARSISPIIMSSSRNSIKKKKKQQTVGFSNTVHVVQYEKFSSQVATDVWYTATEMKQIHKAGKEVMVLYRSIEGADQTTNEERQYQLSQLVFFRGFESCTKTRQRQKVIANRCVLHAQKLGMPPSQIAAIYTVVNSWSNTVAAVQAMYDVVDAIHTNSATINAIPLLFSIPSVHDIPTPRPHPFAIESVRALRTHGRKRSQSTNSSSNSSNNKFVSKTSQMSSSSIVGVGIEHQQSSRRVRQRQSPSNILQ